MKIGLLTFHYSINIGSVLQCHCAYRLLSEAFPTAYVEIIDLIPLRRELMEWRFVSPKFPFLNRKKYLRYRDLRRFIYEGHNYSVRSYASSMENQIRFINNQNYDIIFTGSDTVWMDSKKFGNRLPTIYFLPEGIRSRRCSMAPSVDPLVSERRFVERKHCLKPIFDGYEILTVRDQMTADLLSALEVRNFELLPDPTLLYPFEKEERFLGSPKEERNRSRTPKILLALRDRKVGARIAQALGAQQPQKRFSVESLNPWMPRKDGYLEDHVRMVQDCDVLVTDFFHRSILGLKLCPGPVIYLEHASHYPEQNSKGRDLFRRVGLEDCILRDEEERADVYAKFISNAALSWNHAKRGDRRRKVDQYIQAGQGLWEQVTSGILAE